MYVCVRQTSSISIFYFIFNYGENIADDKFFFCALDNFNYTHCVYVLPAELGELEVTNY